MFLDKNSLWTRCPRTEISCAQDISEQLFLPHKLSLNRNFLCTRYPWTITSYTDVPEQELLMHRMSLNRNSLCTRCSPLTLTLCTQDVPEQELLAHKMYWTGTSCAQVVLNRNFLRTRCPWTRTSCTEEVPEQELFMNKMSLNKNFLSLTCPWTRKKSHRALAQLHHGQWGSLGRQHREEGLQMKTLQLLNKNWVRHPQDSTLFMIYTQAASPSIYNGTCYPYI